MHRSGGACINPGVSPLSRDHPVDRSDQYCMSDNLINEGGGLDCNYNSDKASSQHRVCV